MEVIVPDEFLSIAIGKRGQNVRLASKLTNWHLDVKSETSYSEAMQMAYDTLMALPGVSISLADALYESGFYSVEELAQASVEDLEMIRELDEAGAADLIVAAGKALDELEALESTAEIYDESEEIEASELEPGDGSEDESNGEPEAQQGLEEDGEAAPLDEAEGVADEDNPTSEEIDSDQTEETESEDELTADEEERPSGDDA
jgi:N utilization substance protein A